jgi:hypothetical protein
MSCQRFSRLAGEYLEGIKAKTLPAGGQQFGCGVFDLLVVV